MRTNLIAGLLLATTSAAFAQDINEIRVQQTGIDTQIYAEIKGVAGTDLSTYTLIALATMISQLLRRRTATSKARFNCQDSFLQAATTLWRNLLTR